MLFFYLYQTLLDCLDFLLDERLFLQTQTQEKKMGLEEVNSRTFVSFLKPSLPAPFLMFIRKTIYKHRN